MAQDTIVGEAPALKALREQIRRLATFDTPGNPNVPTVLLQGETGTGKGLVVRAMHRSGGRARGPLIDVNCAAIPDNMLEAELFGFEAGAFTDAKRAKPGLFEAAAGGTLFLDEVDALPLSLQGKLLKAIEEKSIRRLGAVRPQQVDVKLVAATQMDLRELVAAGTFRADLYHRLAVVILEVPPLRARGDDVLVLAAHFLERHAAAHGLTARRLDTSACRWLAGYDWPGNVRELSHLMERVTLLGTGPDVDAAMLERLRLPLRAPSPAVPDASLDDEAARIRDALARTGGNVVGAARILGLGRNALRHRMRRYGIERPTLEVLAAAALPPGAPAGEPVRSSPPSWEQKMVAVLAIEAVFPPSTGTHEPWTLARRWEDSLAERVAGFGGVFVLRSPSRWTAVFGVPRALEQLAPRAVQTALAVQRLRAEREPGPELRMAVHVGAVQIDAAASDPTDRILPVGDTIALAERLLGHAAAGELLASHPTARRIDSLCELRPREVRMGSEPVACWTVVGHRRRGPVDESARFVGRERELALLRVSFDGATAGSGQVVFVVGEAGIGKSRVVAEFRRRLLDTPHLWIEGRCASYGTSTAFLPIVDGLRRFFAIDDRDDESAAGAKLERVLAAYGDDLAWTLPFVRQVLTLPAGDATVARLDSASRRSETFRALKAILLRAAEREPTVVLIEDLHWIDAESEDLLAFISEAVPTTRALLVCSHRPGYRHPFGDRSYHARVTLRALSDVEMTTLTTSLLGGADVPAEVRALIAEKAEGNPFFIEEVTRSLLEDGTLRRDNGRVVLARDPRDIAVPDRIQDVLVARLDRLADGSRLAIQVASVIGREFALRLLERITEAGDRVRTQVEELRALELIYEKATDPEVAYMFKHALTHDVAYESVLHDRRRALHRTIGLAIEELYADRLAEFYETLAHHFGRAEEWEQALRYHDRAAEKAVEHFANRAAIAHCRQALAIADRLGDRVPVEQRRALEERLGLASFYVSEFAASGDALVRSAEQNPMPGPRAITLATAAFSYFWGHAYERAREANEAALALARREHLPEAEALALSNRGFAAGVCDGDIAGEERDVQEALRMAEATGNEAILATIGFPLAQVAEWQGDYRRSIAISEQVIAAGRRLRLAHLVVFPGWFLGKAACCLGDYGRALEQLREAADVCERIGDRVWRSRLYNTLGWCLAEIGSLGRAREYNERALAVAREVGDPEIIANSAINLTSNHLACGDIERALEHLDPIQAALAKPGDPWMRWRYALHATDAMARVALLRGDPERAVVLARDEAAGAARHRVPKVEARARMVEGEALLAGEQYDAADAALGEAMRLAEAIGYPRTTWESLALLATSARRRGRTAEAERHTTRRRELLVTAAQSVPDDELRREFLAPA